MILYTIFQIGFVFIKIHLKEILIAVKFDCIWYGFYSKTELKVDQMGTFPTVLCQKGMLEHIKLGLHEDSRFR
jgi:hypothetical protein